MTKYNFEFKKKVVLKYINENISIRSLAKKYAIKSHNNIEIWLQNIRNMEMKDYIVQEKMKNILSKKRYML